jgi:tetratricopeptide (TPR) repeat protein
MVQFLPVESPSRLDLARRVQFAYPGDFWANHSLGSKLDGAGRHAEAVRYYTAALALRPDNPGVLLNRAGALGDVGELEAALADLQRAITVSPLYAAAHNNLGNVFRRQKKLDEAVAAIRKAIELDPKDAIAYGNLGAALANQGKLDEAIAAHRKAIDLDPNHAKARRHLGTTLGNKGWTLVNRPDLKARDPKRAIETIQEAIEVDPKSEVPWQYLGWVRYRLGDWRASIEALEKSCQLANGGTSGQWIVLALAHAKLAAEEGLPEKEREHHRKEARRWFDQADKRIDSLWSVRPGHSMGQAIWDFRAEARELMGAKESKK